MEVQYSIKGWEEVKKWCWVSKFVKIRNELNPNIEYQNISF